MSRHGMAPPGGGAFGPRGWSAARRAVLVLLARVLARETLIGAAIYACAVVVQGAHLGMAPFAAMLVLLWTLVLAWTCRFGMWRPRGWANAFTEGSLLYVGSVCCTNVLLFALHVPPWTSTP